MRLSPRLPSICAWILFLATTAGIIAILVQHNGYVAQYPSIAGWFLLSPLAGLLLFFTNSAGLSLRSAFSYFGFGLLATLVAFALQSVVNGWLVRHVGSESFTSAMLLGFGSGSLQTLGKFGFIALAWSLMPSRDSAPLLTAGFGVGLGFGVTEALLIGVQLVQTGAPLTGLLGVLERSAAIWFHLCSGGLIAAGIWLHLAKPMFLVVLLHTLMDGLSVYLKVGFVAMQFIFWGLAGATWLAWLFYKTRCDRLNAELKIV